MIRDLTPTEEVRLLTREAVAQLPDGTEVWIKWAGGNGPYRYRLGRDRWGERTVTPADNPHPMTGPIDTRHIGPMRWHHRCFLP